MIGLRVLLFGATLGFIAYYLNDSKFIQIRESIDSSYDYIIVGAGTAGCVLANRLSEDDSVRVLILEAGDDEAKFSTDLNMPLAAPVMQTRNKIIWNDFTVPQKNACLSMSNKQCRITRGKILGGSSSIDCMLYVRGSKHDYDKWDNELGCSGWSYKDVLPYFIKSEHNYNDKLVQSGYHGSTGEVRVADIKATSLAEGFENAGVEAGFPTVDVNGESQLGFMHTQAIVKRGSRISSSKSFLWPVMLRKNLHIATLSHVEKITFEKTKATGVVFYRNNTRHEVKATKEVILSAGAIGSAQILMLSGVGPKAHLDEMKIPLVVDLPVGKRLQDHLSVVSSEYTLREPIAITDFKSSSFWALMDYFLFGTGFLSSPCNIEGTAYFRSENQPDDNKQSEIQLNLMNKVIGNSQKSKDEFAKLNNMDQQVVDHHHGGLDMQDGLTLVPTLLHPRSIGTVQLKSNKPTDRPLVDLKLLSSPEDIAILIEGIRISEKLAQTNMMKRLGAEPLGRVHPRCTEHTYDSSAYWECFIRQSAFPLSHLVGTCKMGSVEDPTAVVGPDLRVIGVDNLRVVDASVMPEIVSGNIRAAVVMIAEKASDMITKRDTGAKANVTYA